MKISGLKLSIFTIIMLASISMMAQGGKGIVKGVVKDKNSLETIIGANVSIKGMPIGTTTGLNGEYQFAVVPGTYTIVFSFISYGTVEVENVKILSNKSVDLNVELEESSKSIETVVVTRKRRANTEMAMISALKASQVVANGVSSQQITRTQDKDASEVVRRIPGISIVDDRFIIVRGLSQRYNNVWMNGSAVPSSEADSRAFSFDMIPSSQLDNITIVKSPAPEYPADFSGGFVQIKTKEVAENGALEVGIGAGYNDQTNFREFKSAPTGNLDFLGFDNGARALASLVPYRLNNELSTNALQIDQVAKNGFNNDWGITQWSSFARPDQKYSIMLNKKADMQAGKSFGVNFAANYSLTNKAYHNMENALIGAYDIVNDRPNYFFKYKDNQYNTDARLGAMLNLSYAPNSSTSYQLRNLFNQAGKNRLTQREGEQYNSGYYQEKQEFLYSSRTSYNGQLSANYSWEEKGKLDWTAGYSYSTKNQPDRRTITRDRNINSPEDLLEVDFNDTKRTFIDLKEHVLSGAANYSYTIKRWKAVQPTIKTGYYGEIKNRDYDTRSFYYIFNETPENSSLKYAGVEDIFNENNFGTNGLYLYEDTRNTDSYKGSNVQNAGYLALSIPYGRLNFYGGVRYENNVMDLTKYVSMDPTDFSSKKMSYKSSDLFPSLNLSYNLNEKNLLRVAYGSTINRPEFRELSSSTYYDFDLFSFVKGNENLKSAYIQNVDLRYEIYPASGEMITFSVFYKKFKDPIETTYFENAGGYTYSFTNASSASNLGAEVDLKKGLGFIGLNDFSLSLNAAYIHSRVKFDGESMEHSRPMQGQSPYLINAGIFYQHPQNRYMMGLMYNIIGERIVGVGRKIAGNENVSVPDIYEQPRNLLDFTFNVKLSKYISLSGAAKNILNQDVLIQQTAKFTDADGADHTRKQTKLKYTPGRSYSLGLSFKL